MARLLLIVRWIAIAALVIAVALIILRRKFPVRGEEDRSTLGFFRSLWQSYLHRRALELQRSRALKSLRGKRALIVDPDEKSARVMEWKLRTLKCESFRVRTGTQAIQATKSRSYDLIVADSLLSDMSAVDLFESLGQREAVVIFVGVLANQWDEIRRLGPNVACMPKPYDPHEVATTAGYLLVRYDDV
jgi:CheY-like chemotaxis protein